MKSKNTFALALLILWPLALGAAPDPNSGHFKSLSVSQTNYVSELDVTNGITLGGVRNTAWPGVGTYQPISSGTNGLATVINVKSPPYNATGDGVTDDTAAIQSAIDALKSPTVMSGTLYFPKGIYALSSPLVVSNTTLYGIKIQGSALAGTIIKTTNTGAFHFESCQNITVSDLLIQNVGGSPAGDAFELSLATTMTFRNMGIMNYDKGIVSTNISHTLSLERCELTGNRLGICGTNYTINAINVSKCMLSGAPVAASILAELNGTTINFEGNTIQSLEYGIRLTGSANSVSIKDNYFETITAAAITLDSPVRTLNVSGNFLDSASPVFLDAPSPASILGCNITCNAIWDAGFTTDESDSKTQLGAAVGITGSNKLYGIPEVIGRTGGGFHIMAVANNSASYRNWYIGTPYLAYGDLAFNVSAAAGGSAITGINRLYISPSGEVQVPGGLAVGSGIIDLTGTKGAMVKYGGTSTNLMAATAGTDYAAPTSGTSVLKGNGSGGFSAATAADLTNTFGVFNGNAAQFLGGDGAMHAQSGGGNVTGTGTPTDGELVTYDGVSGTAVKPATTGTIATLNVTTLNPSNKSGTGNIAFTDSPAFTTAISLNGQSIETQLTNKVSKAGDTITGNLGAALTVGSTTTIDATIASQTNDVTGDMTFTSVINGSHLTDYTAVRWFFNSTASTVCTLNFPVISSGANGWRTNIYGNMTAAVKLTNGTIAKLVLSVGGPTSSTALQTNVYSSLEYYQ